LRARDGVLVLETLLWPDEVRVPDFPFLADNIEVRSQELRMAESLIESMTLDFDPDEYHDSYREALQELVTAKVEGREVLQPVEARPGEEEPSSLADALRASLEAAKSGRPATGEASTSKARPAGAGTAKAGPAKSRSRKSEPAAEEPAPEEAKPSRRRKAS
jgi:DNA end-binding protein Ku